MLFAPWRACAEFRSPARFDNSYRSRQFPERNAVLESLHAKLFGPRQSLLRPLLRKNVASNGPTWLPLALDFGAIGAVAYGDHLVVSIRSYIFTYSPLLSARFSCARKSATACQLGEEFGLECRSEVVRECSSLSARDLMIDIYNSAAEFCGETFNEDATTLVVKCEFDRL
jgi:hypothetical protein